MTSRCRPTSRPSSSPIRAIAESEKILRTCVHCGFCTATCPTYVLLGDELDSPRGRIYLIKDMLENGKPADAEVVKHIDRCLSCLSCMTTCPSGVHYMHLVDHAPRHIEETYRRPLARPAAARAARARCCPIPARFRAGAAGWRGSASRSRGCSPRCLRRQRAGGDARRWRRRALPPRSPIAPAAACSRPQGERRGRVALLAGCAQQVLRARDQRGDDPPADPARRRGRGAAGRGLLRRARPPHGPRAGRRSPSPRRNIDAWIARDRRAAGLDAIVINASGCGTTVKDYGFMLRDDPAYAEKAARISALARDITEYLADARPAAAERAAATCASPITPPARCSTASRSRDEPKELLQQAGFTVKDVPRGPSLLRLGRHLQHPAAGDRRRSCATARSPTSSATRPDVVATGNIGCITQLARGTAIPIVHTVELLDWATGGPRRRRWHQHRHPQAARSADPKMTASTPRPLPPKSSSGRAKRRPEDLETRMAGGGAAVWR